LNGPRARRDALLVAAIALGLRLVVVLWAAGTIPPAADGQYYHRIAARIAEGQGYTWLWPDGAVTYAAHYPVGYPALVAVGYAVFGTKPVVAMILNALVGAAGAVAVWSLVRRASTRPLALAAGIAAAVHPALLPYTAALMTEGVTASLLVVATAFAAAARGSPRARTLLVATGLVMGLATLVRPQSIVFAPLLGWLAIPRERLFSQRVGAAAIATALALGVCAPWTIRNCARMENCALVSVNGGWNLAIGTQTDTGGWHEIAVPEACKTVFQEAAKDDCFGREALHAIAREPIAWLRRAPAKLRVTFDYFGAAPWYLHEANPDRFPYRAKVALGAIETVASRALLVAAIVAMALRARRKPARLVGLAIAGVGVTGCVLVPGVIGYFALGVLICARGPTELARGPVVVPVSAAVIFATALTHAVFFGAGRYGLVVVPFVTALAFVREHAENATKSDISENVASASPTTMPRCGPG
jgi:4-amino-4-deoxy-L-arabinose transferase-like glycosyltransferase